MAWHRRGDKPLTEPMLTYICSIRGRWVNSSRHAFFFNCKWTSKVYLTEKFKCLILKSAFPLSSKEEEFHYQATIYHHNIRHMYDYLSWLNTSRLRQDRRHFADSIFKCIFFNENIWISINISLESVLKSQNYNIQGNQVTSPYLKQWW